MQCTRRALASLTVLFLAAACQKSSAHDNDKTPQGAISAGVAKSDTIKIGLIASLTGKYSALGSEDKKAVELAVGMKVEYPWKGGSAVARSSPSTRTRAPAR